MLLGGCCPSVSFHHQQPPLLCLSINRTSYAQAEKKEFKSGPGHAVPLISLHLFSIRCSRNYHRNGTDTYNFLTYTISSNHKSIYSIQLLSITEGGMDIYGAFILREGIISLSLHKIGHKDTTLIYKTVPFKNHTSELPV